MLNTSILRLRECLRMPRFNMRRKPIQLQWHPQLLERRLLLTEAVLNVAKFRSDEFAYEADFDFSLVGPTDRDLLPSGNNNGSGSLTWTSPKDATGVISATTTGAGKAEFLSNGNWLPCADYSIHNTGSYHFAVDAKSTDITVSNVNPDSARYTAYTSHAAGCEQPVPATNYGFGGSLAGYNGRYDPETFKVNIGYSFLHGNTQVTVITDVTESSSTNQEPSSFAMTLDPYETGTKGRVPGVDFIDLDNSGIKLTVDSAGKAITPIDGDVLVPVARVRLYWADADNNKLSEIEIDNHRNLDVFWNSTKVQVEINDLPEPMCEAAHLIAELDVADSVTMSTGISDQMLTVPLESVLCSFYGDAANINDLEIQYRVEFSEEFDVTFFSIPELDYVALNHDPTTRAGLAKIFETYATKIDYEIAVSPATIAARQDLTLEGEAPADALTQGKTHTLKINPIGSNLEDALTNSSFEAIVAFADFEPIVAGNPQFEDHLFAFDSFSGFYQADDDGSCGLLRSDWGEDDIISVSPDGQVSYGTQTASFQGTTHDLLIMTVDGDDTITVASSFDQNVFVSAGIGDDMILGGAGDDILRGGFGADTISDIAGRNILIGGRGGDTLNGGSAFDVMIADGFDLDAASGDQQSLETGLQGFFDGSANLKLPATLAPFDESGVNTILGGDGRALIIGGVGKDIITGGMGNAFILGDSIRTSAKIDVDLTDLWATPTAAISLLAGTELFGTGDDMITGGGQTNVIIGGGGNDIISGGDSDSGLDFLFGNDGEDTIRGQRGFNFIVGGNGSEKLLEGGDGTDVIVGDDFEFDSDVFDFARLASFVPESAADAIQKFVNLLDFPDTNDANKESFLGMNLVGTGEDVIKTGGGVNLVAGGRGTDTIEGGDGTIDVIYGNSGNDLISGHGGVDFIVGGYGNDEILAGVDGSIETDRNFVVGDNLRADLDFDLTGLLEGNLPTFPSVSLSFFGAGNDTIFGGDNFDFIVGGNGRDTIHGGNGTNIAFGDDFEGSPGKAAFEFVATLINPFDSVARKIAKIVCDVAASAVTAFFTGNDGEIDDITVNDDDYYGGNGTDIVFGGGGKDILRGDGAVDTISSFDFLVGGYGNDDVLLPGVGGTVKDWIGGVAWGGPGDDMITGGNGNDIIGSTLGNDTFYGNDGDDAIFGGEGGDQLFGGDGADYLDGEGGNDLLDGGPGIDTYFVFDSAIDTVNGEAIDEPLVAGLTVDSNDIVHHVSINNPATISGNKTGDITEDATNASGLMSVNDTDDGESFFQAQVGTEGDFGTFDIGTDGAWIFIPSTNANSLKVDSVVTDSFTVTSIDSTASEVVTVTIRGLNDTPTPLDDSASTDAGYAIDINVLDNDTDVDGDSLSVDLIGTPVNGLAEDIGNGVIRYSPNSDFSGPTDTFTYQVNDNHGGTATATVVVTVDATEKVADVDGDTDFDANDSFLLHLVQLSGSDQQIRQSKGSSPLTAGEIRGRISSVGLAADVDGDGDFDANDSFLTHLVKLSGTNNQIDQSKGSSMLTATQIRDRIATLNSPATRNATLSGLETSQQSSLDDHFSIGPKRARLFGANSDSVARRLMQDNEEQTGDSQMIRNEFRRWIDSI